MVKERLLDHKLLIFREGRGHRMLNAKDVRDLCPHQVFKRIHAVTSVRMKEVSNFGSHAGRFLAERDAAAQLVDQFGSRSPRGQVRLFHQLKEQRITDGTDQPPCNNTCSEGFQKIRRSWRTRCPHSRVPQVNPEALVEVDAVSCHHPFTEFDNSAPRVLIGRYLRCGAKQRESIGSLGSGHSISRFLWGSRVRSCFVVDPHRLNNRLSNSV